MELSTIPIPQAERILIPTSPQMAHQQLPLTAWQTLINSIPEPQPIILYIGNNGDVTFGDSLYVRNNNSATNSTVYLNNGSTSANTYNGHIIIESYNATGDGISFGSGAGLGTLTAGNTVSVGPNGFSAGTLYFRNFDQQGWHGPKALA